MVQEYKNSDLDLFQKMNIQDPKDNFVNKKKRIKSSSDLEKIVEEALKSNQKTILIAIYNNQNQKRYIGVKLD